MNKILIVDDDGAIRFLYEEELGEQGYEVITIDNCQDILGTLAHQKPDLIVLDVRIGEYDGLDVLQDIRSTYDELPVILCTSYPIFKYDPKAVSADYFVEKRSDLSGLKHKIKMALEKGRESTLNTEHGRVTSTKPKPAEQMSLDW